VIDRRSALQSLFASPFLLATAQGKESLASTSVEIDEKKKTLLVFRVTRRVSCEAMESIRSSLTQYLKDIGITQPALLLPHEISLDVHEIGQ